jgi:hypothetical protein
VFKNGAEHQSKSSLGDERRVPALMALGQAVAHKPYNEELIQAARTSVLEIGGPELFIEAAFTAAFFEVATKIVDGSRRRPFPTVVYSLMSFVLWMGLTVHTLFIAFMTLVRQMLKV